MEKLFAAIDAEEASSARRRPASAHQPNSIAGDGLHLEQWCARAQRAWATPEWV